MLANYADDCARYNDESDNGEHLQRIGSLIIQLNDFYVN